MNIVLFYQYYHNPDCGATSRHYALLKRLSYWHDITVVTTDAWKHRRLSTDFPWLPDGVSEISYNIPYSNNMGLLQRAASFAHFAFRALLKSNDLWETDVIWGTSTPLTAAWVAHRAAMRLGIPWVFEVRDLWPDFPIQMGAIDSNFVARELKRLEKRLYRSAGHIVALSPDMKSHIVKHGAPERKVTTMLNGTDLDLLEAIRDEEIKRLRARHHFENRRIVLYAGTFGRANDIPSLAQMSEQLADRNDLAIVFMGYGFHEPMLRRLAERQSNVHLLPPQPRKDTLTWFRLADLSLVPFIDLPVLSANSPAKLFDSLGAGTPVIVTNPGWMTRFVDETRTGWYVPAENPVLLAERIRSLLDEPDTLSTAGERGMRIARERLNRAEQAVTYHRIFESLRKNPDLYRR